MVEILIDGAEFIEMEEHAPWERERTNVRAYESHRRAVAKTKILTLLLCQWY